MKEACLLVKEVNDIVTSIRSRGGFKAYFGGWWHTYEKLSRNVKKKSYTTSSKT